MTLTLFHDDAPVLAEVSGKTILNVFFTGGTHYRPSSYLLWLLVRAITGGYHPTVLYAINLWLHILNVALIMWLSRKLRGPHPGPIDVIAGLLFGLYPLSYQSLIWSSAMVHPNMLFWTLLAANRFEAIATRRTPPRALWVAALATLWLALSSHQYGVIAPILIGIVIIGIRARPVWRNARLLALLACSALGYAALLGLIRGGTPDTIASANTGFRLQSSGPLIAQALGAPATIGLPQLGLHEPVIETLPAVLAVTIATMLVTTVCCAHGGVARRWMTGLCWFGVAAAAIGLAVPTSYITGGPRLFYVAAAGQAIVWSSLMAVSGAVSRAASAAVIMAGLLLSALFVHPRIASATAAARDVSRIAQAVMTSGQNDRFVIINHPMTINDRAWPLPFGTAPVLILATGYTPAWELYLVNAGVRRDVATVRRSEALMEMQQIGDHLYEFTGAVMNVDALKAEMRPGVRLFEYTIVNQELRLIDHGALEGSTTQATTAHSMARFELEPGSATLVSARAAGCKDHLQIELEWADIQGIQVAVEPFVHVMHDGNRVFAANGSPLGGHFALELAQPNWAIKDRRTFWANPEAILHADSVRIGVIHKQSGQPKRVFRQNGEEWADNLVTVPVTAGDATMCQ